MPQTKTVYSYDDNGIYIGDSVSYESPLEEGNFLIPANSTLIAPILTPDYVNKWNGQEWQLEPIVLQVEPEVDIEELQQIKILELEGYYNSDAIRKAEFTHNGAIYYLINNSEIRNILTRKILSSQYQLKLGQINAEDEAFALQTSPEETLMFNLEGLEKLLNLLEELRQRQFANKIIHQKQILALTEKSDIKNYNFTTGW